MTEDLIKELKLLSGFPDDNYFSDEELLSILDRELQITVVPLLMSLQEEYFLYDKDVTITQGSYRIPSRSILNKLRDVKVINGDSVQSLDRLFEEDRPYKRQGYYITNNKVELTDNFSGTLRMSYFLTPSKLILSEQAAEIINITSNQVEVAGLPDTFSLNKKVDFVRTETPTDLLALDQTITNISGTTLTFDSLPQELQVGDMVCLSGESPIPHIPTTLYPVLVQAALVTALSSKKDKQATQEFEKLELLKKTMVNTLAPRVESPDIKIRPQGLLSAIASRRGR